MSLKKSYFTNFFRSCKGVTFLCHVTEVECFLNGDSERIALDHQWCIKNSEIDRREKGLRCEIFGLFLLSPPQNETKNILVLRS